MGSQPMNLALRFVLELCALASFGIWGWKQSDGWFRFVLAFAIPIIFASIWGIFAVPDDPSRSGKTVIKTPGVIRLLIEIGFFACAVFVLFNLEFIKLSLVLGCIVFVHYLLSYDRIKWLLSQ